MRLQRISLSALLMALCITAANIAAVGEQRCFNECQHALASCIQSAISDPKDEARCQDTYDRCTEECLR